MDITEHLIDGNVVRGDPTDPREEAERLEKVTGEDIPEGGAGESEKEELVTANTSTIPDTSICLCVKSVEQCAGNKVSWPDYMCCQQAAKLSLNFCSYSSRAAVPGSDEQYLQWRNQSAG
jgi:hypothetical protein